MYIESDKFIAFLLYCDSCCENQKLTLARDINKKLNNGQAVIANELGSRKLLVYKQNTKTMRAMIYFYEEGVTN